VSHIDKMTNEVAFEILRRRDPETAEAVRRSNYGAHYLNLSSLPDVKAAIRTARMMIAARPVVRRFETPLNAAFESFAGAQSFLGGSISAYWDKDGIYLGEANPVPCNLNGCSTRPGTFREPWGVDFEPGNRSGHMNIPPTLLTALRSVAELTPVA